MALGRGAGDLRGEGAQADGWVGRLLRVAQIDGDWHNLRPKRFPIAGEGEP